LLKNHIKLLTRKIKEIVKSDFFKNIFTLMTGTAVAQLITIATIPVLSRLFTPSEFGTFAMFLSLSSVLTAISGGRYELAIMLPKNDKNAFHVFIISMWFVLIVTILSFVILFLFFKPISKLLEIENYRYFIFLIPISVFFQGTYNIFNNWFSRFKDFKTISISKVVKTGTSSFSKVGFAFLNFGSFGLVFGEIVGQVFSGIFLFLKNIKTQSFKKYRINKACLKKELIDNRNFPFFSMPMAFLNSISIDILIYALSVMFNSTIVGLYSQANRVINYPLSFITTSFTSVFYQKITKTKTKTKLYVYSYFTSLIVAFVILLPVMFWGMELFKFILGNEWAISGEIAQLLIPIVIAGFATRNVSSVFSLLKLQQITLIWQILYLSSVITIFFYFNNGKLEEVLLYFSFFCAFMYVFLAYIGYRVLKKAKF